MIYLLCRKLGILQKGLTAGVLHRKVARRPTPRALFCKGVTGNQKATARAMARCLALSRVTFAPPVIRSLMQLWQPLDKSVTASRLYESGFGAEFARKAELARKTVALACRGLSKARITLRSTRIRLRTVVRRGKHGAVSARPGRATWLSSAHRTRPAVLRAVLACARLSSTSMS